MKQLLGVPHNVPPAARAEASRSANESKGILLMECMSESCSVKCSATVAKQSKPKGGARILGNRYESVCTRLRL
jgi:hypothetical protein